MFANALRTLKERNGGNLPFEDSAESLKKRLTNHREGRQMSADILFIMTYMVSITTAKITRPEIFSYTAARSEYITSKYVERVEFFVKRWNYSYTEALQLVAEKIKNSMLRSMFNRYSNNIESGVPDEEFLQQELSTTRNVYRNSIEQGLEMLKKWSDAYIALMLSATIIGIIIMVSVAIYSPDDIQGTLNICYLTILLIALFGIVSMYNAIPDDQKTLGNPDRCSHEQAMIKRIEIFLVPLALLTGIVLYLLGFNPGLMTLVVGVLFAPLAILALRDDINVAKRDEDFSVFIRGLGAVMGGKGLTMKYALAEVDKKSLEVLGSAVDSVYSKLNLGLSEDLVWDRFIGESGSNLINKYLNIFRDSIALGGAPAEIGTIVSSSMLEQVLLRKKREMTSSGFIVLLIPMHIAMIAIFMFLYEILITMSHAIEEVYLGFSESSAALASETTSSAVSTSMMGSMGVFTNFPEEQIGMFVWIVLMLITISNVIAGKLVKGGDRSLYYFFTSILFVLTGIVYIVAPFIIGLFFQIPAFGGG